MSEHQETLFLKETILERLLCDATDIKADYAVAATSLKFKLPLIFQFVGTGLVLLAQFPCMSH